MGIFWIITLTVISISISIYIYVYKDLNIIASIEPDKIPENLKERFIKFFIITLITMTALISLAIHFLDKGAIGLGILMIIISLIFSIPLYYYYFKIKK